MSILSSPSYLRPYTRRHAEDVEVVERFFPVPPPENVQLHIDHIARVRGPRARTALRRRRRPEGIHDVDGVLEVMTVLKRCETIFSEGVNAVGRLSCTGPGAGVVSLSEEETTSAVIWSFERVDCGFLEFPMFEKDSRMRGMAP